MKSTPSVEVLSSSEIELHYRRPLFASMKHIACATDIVSLVREFSNENRMDVKEFFWLLLLTHSNRVLSIVEIGHGTMHCVPVNLREVIQLALLKNSTVLAVCHNHPSGTLDFSKSDIDITTKLKKMCKLFDINLLDHIVITSENYRSMAEEGDL
jgi:DNA repair protein RadC